MDNYKNEQNRFWMKTKRTSWFQKRLLNHWSSSDYQQLTEECNKFKRPLRTGYIDYEKAFDSIEHEAIFKALRSIGINETYITILEDIYKGGLDSIEHEAIFKALRSIGINETYITILEDIYKGSTERVHMDSQIS